MKTVAYIRVSTDKQAKEGSSLQNQKDRIEAYCKAYDLELLEIIPDEGLSARNTKRPGFKKLMDIVNSKQCDAVIVYSLSRFARNTMDALLNIEIMKNNNVAFHSLTEKIDTSSSHGTFFLTVISALAQLESDQLSERVKSVKDNNKKNLKTYSSPIYGFDNGPEGNMTINEDEMKTVKYIQERSKQVSYHKIAKELNDRSERTKTGKKWYASTVYNITNNTVYSNLPTQ